MLDVAREIQGVQQAASQRAALHLLVEALNGALATGSLDAETTQILFDAARRNGVLGLFPLRHPGYEAAVLAARANGMRALRFTHRVVAAIEGAGIPVVVLKGAAAASRWHEPTLRQQSDVDVLVERRNKDAATRALIDAGVCSSRFLDSQEMHNDSLLPAEKSGLLVELHHYFNHHYETHVEVGELLERRQRVVTAQGELPALSREDDAVYLALHAAAHALQRLAWFVDLVALDPDWEVAAERAHAWGVGLAVAPAWCRARELLGVPISRRAMERVGAASAHARLAELVLQLSDATGGDVQRFFSRAFRMCLVPMESLPRVFRRKFTAGREQREAYEPLRRAARERLGAAHTHRVPSATGKG